MDLDFFMNNYLPDNRSKGLIRIKPLIEQSAVDESVMTVTKTEETFVFSSEESADSCINEARQRNEFAAAAKTFKAGKKNKAGEEISPDTWKVTLKFNF